MNSSENRGRDSRFELLRLAGMFFIILTHASAFGIRNLIMPVEPGQMTASVIVNFLLNYPGTVFNVIFVIMTGYFCSAAGVSYRRVALIALQVCLYSWVIAVVFRAAGLISAGDPLILRSVFPLLTGYNWFICCYLVFSLFIPFVNKAVRNFSAGDLRKLILLLLVLRCATAMLKMTLYVTAARDLELFFLLYLIGAYLRLHSGTLSGRYSGCRVWILYAVLVTAFFSAGVVAMCLLYRTTGRSFFLDNVTILLEPAKILGGVCVFKAVEGMRPLRIKKVNALAAAVPGMYLLHENPMVRPLLWTKVFPVLPLLDTPAFIPAMLLKTAAVFAACMVLNLPWAFLIRPALARLLDRIPAGRNS